MGRREGGREGERERGGGREGGKGREINTHPHNTD